MDFIKDLISEHSGTLIETLSGAGFSAEQATDFLPEAASGLTDMLGSADMTDVVSKLSSGDAGDLLSSINVADIATKLGLSPEMVSSGFESIMPLVTKVMSENGGGIAGALSSVMGGGGAGGLLGAAKKLFG